MSGYCQCGHPHSGISMTVEMDDRASAFVKKYGYIVTR
ncbi:hypothetical protein [Sideroxydans sp. CL21]|nr:hypothetical protein [Sideroxydans sp. CL21]